MSFDNLPTASLKSHSNRCVVATCNLNQWSLDFDGNLKRTAESIIKSKSIGAKFRLGPELELSGYGCEDHFLEQDTYLHCEQSLAAILESDLTDGIICEIGSPIMHQNVRYNCRVFCLDRKIILIRPKSILPDDGNYREPRFFTSWKRINDLDDHLLSDILSKATGQTTVKFGMAVILTQETTLAAEVCEELWTVNSPHIAQALAGVEIFTNGSGSHHQLRKLESRLSLIKEATAMAGGAYLYSNHRGCDGGRLYFDGCAMICVNGKIVAQASQFSLNSVEVVSAVIDLEAIRNHRFGAASFQEQSSRASPLPSVDIRYFSLRDHSKPSVPPSLPIIARIHSPEEECALGPACWLWDYLRRSGASGFLLPLSGGADSASVAAIVRTMCVLAIKAYGEGEEQVKLDVHRLLSINPADIISGTATIASADALCNALLHTIYMGTKNSSYITKSRAERLSTQISCYHIAFFFDAVVEAVLTVFKTVTNKTPTFQAHGGSAAEDLALQNIQARLRMVLAYLCAQLFPWCRGRTGFLLVLGSSNVDETLRGYFTKYDCSSADINPIGGICKGDLKNMLSWLSKEYELPILHEIACAVPTAELRPILSTASSEESDSLSTGGVEVTVTVVKDDDKKLPHNYTQADEEEMGMTYAELGVFGVLRKVYRCGPVYMFLKLREIWGSQLTVFQIAEKVKRFFYFYAINRHKTTTLPPSYHAENYSPDDNRYDLRPFLYNSRWTRQFGTIDNIVNDE